MINGPNVTFRRPTVEDDELVFQSYIDWQDLKGPMTRSRASDVLRFMLGENEHSHWPIDYRSEYRDNWFIQWGGVDIGIVRTLVNDMNVAFESLSLIPAYRGLSYFNEIYRALGLAVFEVYQADSFTYEMFDDVGALQAMRQNHASTPGSTKSARVSEASSRSITERLFTRDTWLNGGRDAILDGYTLTIDVALLDSLQASYRRWDGSLGSHSFTATERPAPMYSFLTLSWSVDPQWGIVHVPSSLTLMYDVEA